MYMTAEEKLDMLEIIKEWQKLCEEKTKITNEVILTAKALAAENEALRQENETLKRHLSIAEGAIQRLNQYKEEKFTGYPNSACAAHD